MEDTKFSFKDYDCIGFDLDNTIARYKLGNLISLEYKLMCEFFLKKGYPSDFLSKPIDTNFLIKGLIVDTENGNLVRIGPNGEILQATHGTKLLSNTELLKYYPTRHLNFIDNFVEDPVEVWSGPYAKKMRIMLDHFDMPNSLIFARAVDTVETFQTGKTFSDIWNDILLAMVHMFGSSHYRKNIGGYFPEIRCNASNYYYKCSQNVMNWLKELKKSGKLLFLLTGSYINYASHTATQALGDDWKDYFEIVICGAGKPGFFTNNLSFTAPNDGTLINQSISKGLKVGEIYEHGNWKDLKTFLSNLLQIPEPKFLHIGDNVIQDVYTPSMYSNCDAVTVCEEAQAENLFGFEEPHPDKDYLCSTFWGSYMRCSTEQNAVDSYWFSMMKKYGKICIPSLEYAAKFPIDHEFDLFTNVCEKYYSDDNKTNDKSENLQ